MRKSLQRRSNYKYKPEGILPNQSNNSGNLIMHGTSTNTDRCTRKENIEGLALSEASPLGKTVLKIAHQFVHGLKELSIRKCEVKELEGIIN